MKKWWLVCLLALVAVAGCSNETQKSGAKSDEVMKEVKVEIKTSPDTLKANEPTEIQAVVTQDGKDVADADSVKFEVWKEGNEKHEMLEAKHKSGGIYSISKTFTEDGVYHIIAHTNARDMHVMPEKQVTVGTGTAAESDTHSSGDAHGQSQIGLLTREAKVNTASPLIALIRHEEEPLTEAKVQFEVWKEGSDKHEYVPAKEVGTGQYAAQHTFAAAGAYKIKIHVEKGTLHDHVEQSLTAK